MAMRCLVINKKSSRSPALPWPSGAKIEVVVMSHSQWLNLCQSAEKSSADQLLARFNSSYSTVGFASVAVFLATMVLAISYFRLPFEDKSRMWAHYGWFAGCICSSALMSCLAWGSANGFAGYAFRSAANINM
jgi:hypothetical protein